MPRHEVGTDARRAPRGLKAVSILLALFLTNLPPLATAYAQQKGDAAAQLREQIAALEKVDADAETPPEIRSTNGGFLNERRAQLLGMLKYKAESLRNYLLKVGANLTAAERHPLEKSLADVESEAARLEQEMARTRQSRAVTPAGDAVADAPRDAVTPAAFTAPVAPSAAGAALVPRATAPPAATATCYPNPPALLAEAARKAAVMVVNTGAPGDVFTQIDSLVFFPIADAVSDSSADLSAAQRSFIDTIKFERAKAETRRTDKQVGASARSEGSTSAAEKPGFSELLGFAVEHGAVQQAVDGTTLTLSTSPYSLFLFGKDDDAEAYQNYGYLSRLGLSANFNISDATSPLLSARRQQLSEWSAKIRLSADRSARSRTAQQIWDEDVVEDFVQPTVEIERGVLDIFAQSAEGPAIERRFQDHFRTAAFAELVRGVLNSAAAPEEKRSRIAELTLCQARTSVYEPTHTGSFQISPELRRKIVTKTLPAIATAFARRDEAVQRFKNELKALSERPAFTFAYTNKREAMGSDYSNFRLLYSRKTAERLNIVANGGLSFYHRPDHALNQQSVRDVAAALSFEGTAGRSPFMIEGEDESRITFAFTGRYQRMFENRGAAGKKADIAVGQFKIEVPVFAGMTLPFSVTYANATELVKEDHVRANFGFSLDTDKLRQVLMLGALRRVQ
jgi:hypothetical protein